MGRAPSDEAREREELGGYTHAEFDREFVRSHRSDWASVATRVLTLIIVYGLLARAIHRHDPPPWLLMLPFVAEFLLIFALGWFLSRFVVSCKNFAKSGGSLGLVLFWMVLMGGAMVAAIVFNPGGTGRAATPMLALREAGAWIVRTDLHWALLAMAAALIGSTALEVMRWKRERGVFVWASIMTASFRLGIAFLVAVVGGFILVFAGDVLLPVVEAMFIGGGSALTWAVYGFIVLVEVLTLVVAVLMHRDAMKPPSERKVAPEQRKRRLP